MSERARPLKDHLVTRSGGKHGANNNATPSPPSVPRFLRVPVNVSAMHACALAHTVPVSANKTLLPRGLIPSMPQALAESGSKLYTITLKARSELSSNIDNVKVARVIGRKSVTNYVQSFAIGASPHPLGCAWLMITFARF